ncbi:MAG: hypothetical protein Q9207_006690, partial [Kuettlingeria erythrocarpa]
MAFTKEDDPYPPSLPEMGLPYTSSADYFFDQTYSSGVTNGFDVSETMNFFDDAVPLPHGKHGATVHPVNLYCDRPHSPPSTPTSSSNSSVQHQRHASSNSSRSATIESQTMVPAEAQMHRLRLGSSNAKPTEPSNRTLEAMKTENDLDRQMNELFDFDSAANSPGDPISPAISFEKPIARVAIPQPENSLPNTDRLVLQTCNHRRSAVGAPSLNNAHTPPHPLFLSNAGFVGSNSFGYAQPTFIPPEATYIAPGDSAPYVGPVLLVHDIPPKTRVETQIPITMTLIPMPPGITRLHLPSRTMAKPKLMAKPPPIKSPDMLELDVMPVRASAMKRPDVYARAFAMAREGDIANHTRHGMHRSSADRSDTPQNPGGMVDPIGGRTISICDGCMARERKRANRRAEKDATEEDTRWKQEENQRIVVFNENEVVDWKPYGSPELNQPASKRARGNKGKRKGDQAGGENSTNNPASGPDIQHPEMARQVRLLMRITCYCRHQNEAEGFQVILTLKDHLGNCVAQQISTPILITDDHKTSTHQNDGGSSMTAGATQLRNDDFTPSALSSRPFELNQSHSTTALPMHNPSLGFTAPHRSATTTSLRHQAQTGRSRSTGVPTPSQEWPYQSSVTLTPRHLSRQVSPSASSGPTPKRRKASGFSHKGHRPLVDLRMTQMPPTRPAPDRSQSPSTSPESSSAAEDGLSMAPAAASAPPQVRNLTSDRDASFDTHPSSSGPIAVITASHQAAAQSPQPAHAQLNTDMTAHAQALHHSLLHVPGAVVPAVVAPRLRRVIPSEGPRSGGIEVSIIGEGFTLGLDVLFADAVATQTTVYNSQLIVCVIPPSFQATIVRVTLRGYHQPEPHVWFRYKDVDSEDLMALALKVLHHRKTGRMADPSHIAQSILDGQDAQKGQQSLGGVQHPQGFSFRSVDLELSLLGVIDVVDQTDSVITPRFSARQPNGQTMLHIAASLGYHRLVAGLLARGVNPDLRDRNGMAAMHLACLRGHTKVVRKLLSAGGDPTLRSLLGLAPIDMATNQEVYQLMSAIAHHTRSRSVGATPVSQLSRATSVTSSHSTWGTQIEDQTLLDCINPPYEKTMVEAYKSRPATPAEAWARSRRNSASDKQCFLQDQSTRDPTVNTHMVAGAAATAAWRDNLAGQIQQFQQSVQRTLPNLQIPNLPPLPNFEGYQEHPMVRRISSLVPRMNSPPAPPAYDEIYPDAAESDAEVKKASIARAAGDALMDDKCAANFDQPGPSSSSLIRAMGVASTKDQREALRLLGVGKVKKLSNDRKLFFIW